MRMFDRAYSKTLFFEEEFEAGIVFYQDYATVYEKKIEHEPDFKYFIDYEFSCDVDVWGRVSTNKASIGSVYVSCDELGILNRHHLFEDIAKEDSQAAAMITEMVYNRIETKYERGYHLD